MPRFGKSFLLFLLSLVVVAMMVLLSYFLFVVGSRLWCFAECKVRLRGAPRIRAKRKREREGESRNRRSVCWTFSPTKCCSSFPELAVCVAKGRRSFTALGWRSGWGRGAPREVSVHSAKYILFCVSG